MDRHWLSLGESKRCIFTDSIFKTRLGWKVFLKGEDIVTTHLWVTNLVLVHGVYPAWVLVSQSHMPRMMKL
jgi:hypothetical protein